MGRLSRCVARVFEGEEQERGQFFNLLAAPPYVTPEGPRFPLLAPRNLGGLSSFHLPNDQDDLDG